MPTEQNNRIKIHSINIIISHRRIILINILRCTRHVKKIRLSNKISNTTSSSNHKFIISTKKSERSRFDICVV